MRTAVVVGALGVIGRYIVDHLLAIGGWRVIGLSRRTPDFENDARYISVDLLDRADAEAKLSALSEVTHVFYCAFQARAKWAEHNAPNLAMLVNAVEPIAAASPGLRHVNLIEGNKIYGSHLGPFKTPAREDDPPHMLPNFYWDQERWLESFQKGKPWTWSALRPHTVCGFALANPMNITMVIAVYAAISKELGLPLRFPGTPGAYNAVYQVTDSALLARAMVFCATSPNAANQVFNVTNGDFFRWCNAWPKLARAFDMEWAPPQTISLTEFMADKAPLWAAMQQRHHLVAYPYEQLAAWPFGDYVFRTDWDVMTATLKLRKAGFQDCEDSEAMLVRMMGELRQRRIVP
ncbi:MAG: SDR family oxidoreductase [Hyphomicrobiaceae bacterium]